MNSRTARRPSFNICLSPSLSLCLFRVVSFVDNVMLQLRVESGDDATGIVLWHAYLYIVRQSGDPSAFFHSFIFHENINEIQHKINKAIINWRMLKSCSCWCHPGPVHTQSDRQTLTSLLATSQTRRSPKLKISSLIRKHVCADCDLSLGPLYQFGATFPKTIGQF